MSTKSGMKRQDPRYAGAGGADYVCLRRDVRTGGATRRAATAHAAAASQSVSQSSSAPAQSSGSTVAPSNSSSSQSRAAPRVVHARTRAT